MLFDVGKPVEKSVCVLSPQPADVIDKDTCQIFPVGWGLFANGRRPKVKRSSGAVRKFCHWPRTSPKRKCVCLKPVLMPKPYLRGLQVLDPAVRLDHHMLRSRRGVTEIGKRKH